jgi:6-phosphogluconolactonase (cycloisomerase 2 family)
MNMGKWAQLLLAAPLLAGCSNFWQSPTSTTTTTTTTTLSSGVFYVLNVETSQIVAYDIVSGTLTKLGTYATPAVPLALAVSPNGGFLYLSTANGIYMYTVASGGTLTLGNDKGIISSDTAYTMQVDSTNSWLIEAISGSTSLCAIPLSTSTGLPPTSSTEQCATLPSTTVQQLTIAPKNNYVFVALGKGGTAVVPFTAGNTSPFGTVGNIGVKGSGGAALSVAVDPSSRLFYIGETVATSGSETGGVRAFTLASLPSVAELSGSPYTSKGLAPYSILPLSTGDYIYVANRQTSSSSSGVIAGFSFTSSSSTYSLTALSGTVTAGTHPVGLAEDSSKQFVLAVSVDGSPDLEAYFFDTTTNGQLDATITSTTGTDPVQASAVVALPQ